MGRPPGLDSKAGTLPCDLSHNVLDVTYPSVPWTD